MLKRRVLSRSKNKSKGFNSLKLLTSRSKDEESQVSGSSGGSSKKKQQPQQQEQQEQQQQHNQHNRQNQQNQQKQEQQQQQQEPTRRRRPRSSRGRTANQQQRSKSGDRPPQPPPPPPLLRPVPSKSPLGSGHAGEGGSTATAMRSRPPLPPPPPPSAAASSSSPRQPCQDTAAAPGDGRANTNAPASTALSAAHPPAHLSDTRDENEATSCPSRIIVLSSRPKGTDEVVTPTVDNGLAAVRRVYGPAANLYADVLRVPATASIAEIREAFFCIRYELSQQLEHRNPASGGFAGGAALTSEERRAVESQMEAITGAFQVLGDQGRRSAYDAAVAMNGEDGGPAGNCLSLSKSDSSARSRGPSCDGGDSVSHLPLGQRRSVFRRRRLAHADKAPVSLGMNQSRRAVAEPVLGGLNTRPGPKQVKSADNPFVAGGSSPSDASSRWSDSVVAGTLGTAKSDSSTVGSIRTDNVIACVEADGSGHPTAAASDATGDGVLPQWSNFGNTQKFVASSHQAGGATTTIHDPTSCASNVYQGHAAAEWRKPEELEVQLPAGVDNLNARELLLYKNQMYISKQKQLQQQQQLQSRGHGGRLGSRYDAHDRGDTYAVRPPQHDNDHEEGSGGGGSGKVQTLTSPTGVEEFDRAVDQSWMRGSVASPRCPSPATTADSSFTEDAAVSDDQGMANKKGAVSGSVAKGLQIGNGRTGQGVEAPAAKLDDDNTRTYDDATTTSYADETAIFGEMGDHASAMSYADETATFGDTIDEQTEDGTWVSEYGTEDDATSYATESLIFGDRVGMHSPGHKKGTKPLPILRSGLRSGSGGVKRANSDGKRVTVHAHRGRGDEVDDFSLFDGAVPACPALPSLTAIREEVVGTYKDFTSALHQVGNAFVINPDDIDRVADKIRDAKIEIGENYHQQVQEQNVPMRGGKPQGNKKGERWQTRKQRAPGKNALQLRPSP